MSFLGDLRTILLAEPRASRAFVTGGDVDASKTVFGLDGSTYQPPEYATYLATSNGVYACINARTKALSSLPIRLYSKKVDAKGNRSEIMTGPAWDLLQSVNPFWTFGRWMDMTEQALCIWGESFTFYAKRGNRPAEMWWARADKVKVHPHPADYISHFTYDPGNGSQPIRFEPDETLWLRFPNVNDQWEGLSPLAAARLSADTASAAMRSNFNIFRNGIQASALIGPKSGTNLTKEQAQELADHFDRRFKGVDKAHRVGVLRFDADVKQLSMTPKDAEFLGALNWSLEDIARAYAVPIDKVGGKRTYQNVDDSERVFWTDCILPEARFIAAEITEQLLPLFGGEMVAEFDDSGVDVLHEAETAKWERWQGQITVGARTINEYRQEHGLKPVEWGDNWWAQTAVSPLLAVPKTTEELAIQSGRVDAGKPADSLAETLGEDEEEPEPAERSHKVRTVAYGSPEHEAMWQRKVQQAEPWEQRVAMATVEQMQRQKASALARLTQRGVRTAEKSAIDPFDQPRFIKAFRISLRPIMAGVLQEAGELARDEVAADLGFDVQDPSVIQAIEQLIQRFAEEVTNTTWEALREALTEGVGAGESLDQLTERVEGIMGDRIRSAKGVIARTEVSAASNAGTLAAWKQSGVVTKKRWLAALDDRTRQTHVEAHNQTVGIDEPFLVGVASGSAPGLMSSARESINCRCSMTAVLDVEGL